MSNLSASISNEQILNAYRTMRTARHMSDIYEENAKLTSKYVHACSNGLKGYSDSFWKIIEEAGLA